MYPTEEGYVSVSVPNGAAVDLAKNPNLGSNTITFLFDTTVPAVNLNSTVGWTGVGNTGYAFSPETNVVPVPLTVTFSEAVTSFIDSDIFVSGASFVSGTFTGGPSQWTIDLMPLGACAASCLSLQIPSSAHAGWFCASALSPQLVSKAAYADCTDCWSMLYALSLCAQTSDGRSAARTVLGDGWAALQDVIFPAVGLHW